ncbi:MAG TPA: hypothetical protein VLM84_03995, partial [Chromatiaceae bacterium]|nr:hypothetical protein [Chromatiaceae bacterium]
LQAIPACRISGKYLLHANRLQHIGATTYFPSEATPLSDGLGLSLVSALVSARQNTRPGVGMSQGVDSTMGRKSRMMPWMP